MGKDAAKPEQRHEAELELVEPLLGEEDALVVRERTIQRLTLLWKERRFLARAAGVGMIAATLIAFLIPKQYRSTTRLMPPDQGPGAGMAMMAAFGARAGSLGSLGSELLGLKTTGDLFIGILGSRTVQDDLITKFNLRKVYGDNRWEDARRELAKRTDVSQDRKSEIITIAVTDRKPQRAQHMAEEYISALNNVVVNLNTSSAHRERVFLEDRLNQVNRDLESAEKNFSQFASKNTAINIEEQGKAMITAGATLEGQLIAAETELEGLRQIFTDNNVRVRETQARVDELNRQLRKLGGKPVSDTPGAQDQGTPYPTIRQLPVLGVTYADLYRRMKVEDAVFQTLTQQYEAAKVEEAKETPSVKVLDPPDAPDKKAFPPRSIIIFLGVLMSFAVAVTWVLAREAWETTDATDARKVFANQVWTDVRSTFSWVSRNGHNGAHAARLSSPLREKSSRNLGVDSGNSEFRKNGSSEQADRQK
jgi:capsule polysaccharide export protein KpsE/RkpR